MNLNKNQDKKLKFKNLTKYMPSVGFCFIIFSVFIMFLVVPKKDYSPQEKRSLSDMPNFSMESLLNGDFGKDFETYLADQMPMRTAFVGLNSYYELCSGRNGSNGIYKAQDNYLFTTPVNYNDGFDKNIGYINEFAENIDSQAYMCIVPTSGYIMSEKLPIIHYEYNDDKLIDMAKDSLEKLNSKIEFVDITETFQIKSDSEQLYYKTDHHWTSQGAYECYTVLGDEMGFAPTEKSQFNIESFEGFYGTSYGKGAWWNCQSESIEVWKNKNHTTDTINVGIFENGELLSSNSMFFMDNMETDDKYTTFLDGNHGLVTITNNSLENGDSLLILRDSYTHCLAPFLADNYSKIILVDLRYYKDSVSELVKSNNIDQVLVIYGIDNIVNGTDIAYLF